MSKRNGPQLTIKASCFDCSYERSEHYTHQSDSGCKVYCAHPLRLSDHPEQPGKRIGDTTWETPTWCPLLDDARAALSAKGGAK